MWPSDKAGEKDNSQASQMCTAMKSLCFDFYKRKSTTVKTKTNNKTTIVLKGQAHCEWQFQRSRSVISVVWRPTVQESIMAEVQGVGSCAFTVAMKHERKKPGSNSPPSIPPMTFRFFPLKVLSPLSCATSRWLSLWGRIQLQTLALGLTCHFLLFCLLDPGL